MFFNLLNEAIFTCDEDMSHKDEWKAHMWQGFQSSADSSGDKAKWANVISSKKSKRRIILNSRRMAFDCEAFNATEKHCNEAICTFVQNLLLKALSFSLETLEKSPSDFVKFLDSASRLRELSLNELDKDSTEAYCICVNLYHCLLQHALLLSKTGPPTKKNVGHFMCTHCYEIGGDVFSLAELESCVIRGNMSKPSYTKAPHVRPPKNSTAHYAYALDFMDVRTNFILSTGRISDPPCIPVLKPSNLEEQLTTLSQKYLSNHFKTEPTRRIIILPKVCEIYRNDFGRGDFKTCALYCLQYLNGDEQALLIEMLNIESGPVTFKSEQNCDRFHASLKAY